MNRIVTIITLALLAVSTVRGEGLTLKKEGDKVRYDTYIRKADSLYLCGEFAQACAMFERAFQTGYAIEGRDLYNAACLAALTNNKDFIRNRAMWTPIFTGQDNFWAAIPWTARWWQGLPLPWRRKINRRKDCNMD